MKTLLKLFATGFIIFIIYRGWFGITTLASGDWHYLFPDSLSGMRLGFWAWDFSLNNGLGGNDIFILGLNSYFLSGSYLFLHLLHFPWEITERIMWFFPFLAISLAGSTFLYKTVFPKSSFWPFAPLIFLGNTYVLLIMGGGQVGVGIAIALTPFVLGLSMRAIESLLETNHKTGYLLCVACLAGIVLALQIFFDLRFVYITLIAVLVLISFHCKALLHSKKKIFILLVIPFLALLLNVFWILPQLIVHTNLYADLGSAYSSTDAVKYFSFAKFEYAFGLLHPNWPDNIFGEVAFMRPEFLLLPLLAFSSLLFVRKYPKGTSMGREDLYVIFFALIGLLGIFLAKGANDPFGNVYLWMFAHVPGFIMFRDPTKWYLLIVLSYTVLIPYDIEKISLFIKKGESK